MGLNRLNTVLPVKLYAEDELKIRQKSTEISREYPLLAGVTVTAQRILSPSEFRHLQFMTILNHFTLNLHR